MSNVLRVGAIATLSAGSLLGAGAAVVGQRPTAPPAPPAQSPEQKRLESLAGEVERIRVELVTRQALRAGTAVPAIAPPSPTVPRPP